MKYIIPFLVALGSLFLVLGCSNDQNEDRSDGDTDHSCLSDSEPSNMEEELGIESEMEAEPEEPVFDPYMVRSSESLPKVRGYVVKQGNIHGHNVFSHDACDNQPRVDGETGARNEECYWEFRDSLCQNAFDFMFVTDHTSGMFCEFEYPEELYYESSKGDELIEHDGSPSANRMMCDDGRRVLMAAGFDGNMMVIGLEHHLRDTSEERHSFYDSLTNETIAEFQAHNALVTAHYASDWDAAEILKYNWDGYEVYNPATNLRSNMGKVISAMGRLLTEPETMPVSELMVLLFFEEGETNMLYWSNLVLKQPVFNYIGPNAHRNALPGKLPDGERLDSYRRIQHWYLNYVLLPQDQAAEPDDRVYKEALKAGRLYNTFAFFGYPEGFDFHAKKGEEIYEMGAILDSADGVDLVIKVPRIYGQLPDGTQKPEITAKLLRAVAGGWQEVASGKTDYTHTVTEPGVYRVDVRIVPNHLLQWLGEEGASLLVERSWVYSGSIFIGMDYRR